MQVTLTVQEAGFICDAISFFSTPDSIWNYQNLIRPLIKDVTDFSKNVLQVQSENSQRLQDLYREFYVIENNDFVRDDQGKPTLIEGKTAEECNEKLNILSKEMTERLEVMKTSAHSYELDPAIITQFGSVNIDKLDFILNASPNEARDIRTAAVVLASSIMDKLHNANKTA